MKSIKNKTDSTVTRRGPTDKVIRSAIAKLAAEMSIPHFAAIVSGRPTSHEEIQDFAKTALEAIAVVLEFVADCEALDGTDQILADEWPDLLETLQKARQIQTRLGVKNR